MQNVSIYSSQYYFLVSTLNNSNDYARCLCALTFLQSDSNRNIRKKNMWHSIFFLEKEGMGMHAQMRTVTNNKNKFFCIANNMELCRRITWEYAIFASNPVRMLNFSLIELFITYYRILMCFCSSMNLVSDSVKWMPLQFAYSKYFTSSVKLVFVMHFHFYALLNMLF